jgi:hypothetical protein
VYIVPRSEEIEGIKLAFQLNGDTDRLRFWWLASVSAREKAANVEDMKNKELEGLRSLFSEAIKLVNECYGKQAFRPSRALNAAVFDAVMVGLASCLKSSKGAIDPKKFMIAYEKLLKDRDFLKACERATAREDTLETRQKLSIAAFKSVWFQFVIEQRFAELEKLILAAQTKGLDEQTASYLCKLGSVLICGNLERCIEHLFIEKVGLANRRIATFLKRLALPREANPASALRERRLAC